MLRIFKTTAIVPALLGMWLATPTVHGDEVAVKAPNLALDIELQQGTLKGRVVTAAGKPAQTTVAILEDTQEIARTNTNATGEYQFSALSSGVYTVSTPRATRRVRLWDKAAPADAASFLTLQEGDLVRGNLYAAGGAVGGATAGGGGAAALGVAAAVVGTTAAVTNSNDDPSSPPVSP